MKLMITISLAIIFAFFTLSATEKISSQQPDGIALQPQSIEILDMVYPCEYPWQTPPRCR